MYSVATQKQFLDQRDTQAVSRAMVYIGEPLFLRSIRALNVSHRSLLMNEQLLLAMQQAAPFWLFSPIRNTGLETLESVETNFVA